MREIQTIEDVVEGGFCVGCGACAAVDGGEMRLDANGCYLPVLPNSESPTARESCPWLEPELNEDQLAKPRYENDGEYDPHIGWHHAIFGGFAKESDFRAKGTSGGMGTWIGVELLRKGLIDGVIHVKATSRSSAEDPFFAYALSHTEAQIRAGAQSRYHVVELSTVLDEIAQRGKDENYLFIGVPCLVKAVRRLQRLGNPSACKIKYTVSLVCGHFKSVHWTLSLGWAHGIPPDSLDQFQYRTKSPDIPARAYVFRATANSQELPVVQADSATVPGGKYNAGALMVGACEYCDDVVGETADFTVGDAWLPQFETDPDGTNLLISRTPAITSILESAFEEERVHLVPLSADQAKETQSGGFRQRREGLSYRLKVLDENNVKRPIKRVSPDQFKMSGSRQKLYRMRSKLTRTSREAFRSALDARDFSVYESSMKPQLASLRRMEIRHVFWRAVRNRLSRTFHKFLRKTGFNVQK